MSGFLYFYSSATVGESGAYERIAFCAVGLDDYGGGIQESNPIFAREMRFYATRMEKGAVVEVMCGEYAEAGGEAFEAPFLQPVACRVYLVEALQCTHGHVAEYLVEEIASAEQFVHFALVGEIEGRIA